MRKILLILLLLPMMGIKTFAQDKSNFPLTETHWILTNLNDKVINKNDEGLESFIVFSSDNTFKGFGGCNKYQGNYLIEKGKLTCDKIGATKMECENNNNEEEFLKTLGKVVSFKISKNQLMLKDKNKTIAVFESK
ncbi:MAG TPA: META domain-containing protein [Bacteroidia bacterium]|nr:META domain-containing protein [Bacteroidia bacterium]